MESSPKKSDQETLLGFDAREWYRKVHQSWDQKRRDVFLLKQDVEKVLSTDTGVWPSLFDIGDSRQGYHPDEEVALLDPPSFTNSIQDMWDNLDHLQKNLAGQSRERLRPSRTIAVTLVTPQGEDDELESWHAVAPSTQHRFPARLCWKLFKRMGRTDWWKYVPAPHNSRWLWRVFWKRLPRIAPGAISPSVRPPEWELLGYDVSDGSLLSGLSNCGYREDESEELKREFGGYLNQYHLFDDLEAAREFREITNEQVPEHAPFFVYGLWDVRSG